MNVYNKEVSLIRQWSRPRARAMTSTLPPYHWPKHWPTWPEVENISQMTSSTHPGHLSARGSHCLKPALPYFAAFGDLQAKLWSKEQPDGNIIIAVAENKLNSDMVYDRMKQCSQPPLECLNYPTEWSGKVSLRKALSGLCERTFMNGIMVDPDHISALGGAGVVLEQLFWCLAGPKDGVLIPRPYYPSFDYDMNVKGGLEPVPMILDENDVAGSLTRAANESKGRGHPIKILLLTNPHNPLGTLYPRTVLVEALKWALSHNVHLISDEIYALSVWGEGASFESLEVIARQEAVGLMPKGEEKASELLHIVFGLSKDFCASGLRVGCLHSRNTSLNKVLKGLGYFSGVPQLVQHFVTEMISDEAWTARFVKANNEKLRNSWSVLSKALTDASIPFTAANSAMFAWVDLRALLTSPSPTFDDEMALWKTLAYDKGVLITPGMTCHAVEPGFFRMCWAWVEPEALVEAVRRISDLKSMLHMSQLDSAVAKIEKLIK